MSALGETLRALAAVLDRRGLRWFVFGAQAVSVRAAPRATQDVDVTVEVPPKELEGLVAALEQAGLDHRYPEIADRLLASGAVLPLIHTSGMEVDLVVAGSGLETLALGRADRLPVDGVEVPVAHPTDLVVMKVLSGRGKDQEDLRGLLASSDVDVVEARDLLMQLEEALGRSDLVPMLDAALRDVEDRSGAQSD
ncbi:MAG: nucleotidyltransferase [Myxococcales bacterium]|nr:nucleotidyltransferase [Myxococcales bacterium]